MGWEASTTTKGRDFVLDAAMLRGSRMGGDAFKFTYFQSLIREVALGGYTKMYLKPGAWTSPVKLAWGLNGVWQSTDMSHAVLGSYDREQSEAWLG